MKTLFTLLISTAIALTASARNREVSVYNHNDHITLAGTLSTPDNDTPRAAIVLTTGSGAQDRDETIYGHKPFKAIAEALRSEGYAVLRLDDRGVGGSDKGGDTDTTDNFAGDISAAISFLDSLYSSTPKGIVGHSEGGTIAIKNAANNPNCDFIITLAAPAFRGDSIIISQVRAIFPADGSEWQKLYTTLRHRYDIVMSTIPTPIAQAMLLADVNAQSPAAMTGAYAEQTRKEVAVMVSPWYREFLRYDPKADIQAIQKPWLAINGDKDTQVTPDNLDEIKRLCPGADTVLLSGHNHLMLKCTTGLPQEYPTLSGDISTEVLSAITTWLNNRY
jgi:hypothetical protein